MTLSVAVDARSVQKRPWGGVGRGMAHVLRQLTGRLDLHLLTAAELPTADLPGTTEHAFPTPWPGHESLWLQRRVPPFLRSFDGVFHCPWYALPLQQPVPMVATIHDLTFEHFPSWFRFGQGAAYRYQARLAARTAKVVVTVSQFVADDLMATYRLDPDRLTVIRWGIDPLFSPDNASSESIDRRPYVVAVGGAARRGADIAVAAWRSVSDQVDLVVLGGDGGRPEPGVTYVQPDDTEWAQLLAGAFALVYPTRYEGFGMPPLEAMASGTPVLCARVGSLPEVLGDAAGWVDDLDATAFAIALADLLKDHDRHDELRERGLAHAANQPTWPEVAAAYASVYATAAA